MDALVKNGFFRLSSILMKLTNSNDKQEIIRLSNIFIDDAQEFVALLYVENEIGDEDVEKFKQGMVDVEKEAMKEFNMGESATEGASTSVGEEQKVPADSVPHSPADDL